MVKNPKFQIFSGKNDDVYFRLYARNGEQILSSEGYASLKSCENGIESVRKNSADAGRFEKKIAKDGRFFFSLTAANGQTIGGSQMYKTESGRDNGIGAVQRIAAAAPVEDTTQEEA